MEPGPTPVDDAVRRPKLYRKRRKKEPSPHPVLLERCNPQKTGKQPNPDAMGYVFKRKSARFKGLFTPGKENNSPNSPKTQHKKVNFADILVVVDVPVTPPIVPVNRMIHLGKGQSQSGVPSQTVPKLKGNQYIGSVNTLPYMVTEQSETSHTRYCKGQSVNLPECLSKHVLDYSDKNFSFDPQPDEESASDDEDKEVQEDDDRPCRKPTLKTTATARRRQRRQKTSCAGHGSGHGNKRVKKRSSNAQHQSLNNPNDYIDEGDPSYKCNHCGAKFWFGERLKKDTKKRQSLSFSMCCQQGKVALPLLVDPPEALRKLFMDKDNAESKEFLANIRQYNNMFSFTSMGGKVNHKLNSDKGVYTFVLSGMNHHNIGSLLPEEGKQPAFSQLYIYDTENEVQNRISAVSKHQNVDSLKPVIVSVLKDTLDEVNPYVQQYRYASASMTSDSHVPLKLQLLSERQHDGRVYNLPTASEVAALIVGDLDMTYNVRDVIVTEKAGHPQRITKLHPAYLPLQYPILFPYGEDGYRDDVLHHEDSLAKTKTKKRVSLREFFAFRLMHREHEMSTLLHASRLLMQFIVDAYTMIEAQRLLWVRTHQKELRAELYEGITEAVLRWETDASSTGKRVVLPSSFTGGARYMLQNYQDAMAICRWAGYPDIFLTFTCNPAWPEITRYAGLMKIRPESRPDVLSRVFRMKLHTLMKTIREERIFGRVRAEVYTIEFQKRGLPHAHILLFLEPEDKVGTPDRIDELISAEIPDNEVSPRLYDLVQRFMVHGPCGHQDKDAKCMKDGQCSKYYPKTFTDETSLDEEGFPTYRRRNDGRVVEVKKIPLDNRYVVPYNKLLLQRFEAHINVERCNQSTAIKYLFKYISKGSDWVVAGVFDSSGRKANDEIIDEIQQFYNCRYIASCESSWRIFGFEIHHRYPSVERLSFHLPNRQYVVFPAAVDMSSLVTKPRVCESQFLAWMKRNAKSEFARTLTYQEFPQHFVFNKAKRKWKKRKRGESIGRVNHASPSSGELYYLRVLLTKVRGPTSYNDIKTVKGKVHETFREACFAQGLLDDDSEYIGALFESASWSVGNSLRRMFVTMLLSCSIHRPDHVWEKSRRILSEDLLHISKNNPARKYNIIATEAKEQEALRVIDQLLRGNGKSLQDFPSLPQLDDCETVDVANNLILQELMYDRATLSEHASKILTQLTDEQRCIYNTVMSAVNNKSAAFFFVHGFGGTGKTFLWNALSSTIRGHGDIVLTVASSGIAATLLPGGRTAHSRFTIPVDITETSTCSIQQHSPVAELIRATKLIIWDEAPMVQRYCLEAFDRSMRDIMHSNLAFGGKCIVMGGDFRQILPVIPKGNRAMIVDACISSSHLWDHCKIFHLTKNMRLLSGLDAQSSDQLKWFSEWLLSIGDGKLGVSIDGKANIHIPEQLLVPQTSNPIASLVSTTYSGLLSNVASNAYFNDRAILAPTIAMVNKLNDHVLSLLPTDAHTYHSYDSVCASSTDADAFDDLYTTEFLNTISCSGLPPHTLTLKVGAPIMLLRNIDQSAGLCNGTRLRVTKLGKHVVGAVTLNGSHPNQDVLLHRMDMNPSESKWPFKMRRRQFPIQLSFAMTINKSQGQTLRHVGLYLEKPVFYHGQLYVAISRVRSIDGLRIYVPPSSDRGPSSTTNVVYQEVFRKF